jgi:hypothetical protein
MVAVNLLDILPNATIVPFTFLAAGSVAGAVRVKSGKKAARPVPASSTAAVAAQ